MYICPKLQSLHYKMSTIIEHRGTIKKIFSDKVIVQIEQVSACAGCHAKQACTIADKADKIIEIATSGNGFEENEVVNIQGKNSLGLLAVWYAFVLPLLFLFVVLFLSFHFFQNEGIASLAALGILIVYYITLYIFRDKLKRKFIFEIHKIK